METRVPIARAAIVEDDIWDKALAQALAQVSDVPADLVFLFASDIFSDAFPEMVRRVYQETGASVLIGCSGQSVVGTGQELEDLPAISLLALSLPDSQLRPLRFTQEMIDTCNSAQDWRERLDLPLDDVNSLLILADPFHLDCEGLVDGLTQAYPGIPMLGGLASGDFSERQTYVFYNGEVFEEGGVGLALGGAYTILPLVSQGCEPIGEPWTITRVRDNGLVVTISNRSAYTLLIDTLEELNPEMQRRAQRNLLIGLAADEYRDTFERGSFLIRQLLGIDRRTGSLVIGALPRVGQTIQFQIRDATTADLDLRELLKRTKTALWEQKQTVIAGILCTCNGRGMSMFGVPHHDAELIEKELGALPLTGLFCNGEIGPIGKRAFLHGFTASLALLVRHNHEQSLDN